MKKLSLLLLLSVSCALQAVAQRYEYGEPVPVKSHRELGIGKARFGVFIAPTISWMKPTANKSDDKLYVVEGGGSKVGFTWGLLMDYYFAENYGIATGFQLNHTGGQVAVTLNPNVTPPTGNNIVRSADFDYSMQYAEVPFALKLRSDEISTMRIRVYGQIGLTAGITLSKKATYDVIYTDVDENNNSVVKTAYGDREKLKGLGIAPVLLQMNIGGGIEIPVTDKMSIYTGLFFNNGFVPDVTNPKELDLDYKGRFSDGNVRLNNIALRLGMFF